MSSYIQGKKAGPRNKRLKVRNFERTACNGNSKEVEGHEAMTSPDYGKVIIDKISIKKIWEAETSG